MKLNKTMLNIKALGISVRNIALYLKMISPKQLQVIKNIYMPIQHQNMRAYLF